MGTASASPETAAGTSTLMSCRARNRRPQPKQAQIEWNDRTDEESKAENMREAYRGVAPARSAQELRDAGRLERREQSLHGLVAIGVKHILPVAEEQPLGLEPLVCLV